MITYTYIFIHLHVYKQIFIGITVAIGVWKGELDPNTEKVEEPKDEKWNYKDVSQKNDMNF
jgi:hypothetical protein